MNAEEILRLRDVYAELGFEYTPDELIAKEDLTEYDSIKERFRFIVDYIADLKVEMDAGSMNLKGFTEELSRRTGMEISMEMGFHFLLMYKVFKYD